MSLTIAQAPLAAHPADANYRLEGPAHRLFFEPFARRVRAVLAAETVLDTRRGRLLHETGLLPQLYVPREDTRFDCFERTDTRTICPFKGEASYWSIRVGERVATDAVWAYLEPREEAGWLRGYVALYWQRVDSWLDEDERVFGHLHDPYHRVDVRASGRHVRVLAEGEVLAETTRSKLLAETGLPNRYYVPAEDVRGDRLEPSGKRTLCPYKGEASYAGVRLRGRLLQDAAWRYAEPLEEALKVRGYWCFAAEGIVVEVDGEAEGGRA